MVQNNIEKIDGVVERGEIERQENIGI